MSLTKIPTLSTGSRIWPNRCAKISETLIESEKNGLLAGNDQEWFDALDRLIGDEKFRKQIASAGLSTINEGYTREKSYHRLREVLVAALD